MGILNWLQFLAGIYLFIFAMWLVEDALKHLAGRRFRKFLQRQANHKLRSVAGGTIVTAMLQSSSVVLMIILSFVGAGIMNMRHALAVTLGANLGTTLDSWIVALLGFEVKLDAIAYPALALSLVVRVFFPGKGMVRHVTLLLSGLSLVFVGLEWMKESTSHLTGILDIKDYAGWSPYLFVVFGIMLTAIIQSSSATMAITLTALFHGLIPFVSAMAIVAGSETGTTLKILFSSVGGVPDKKRVAVGNFIFNALITIAGTIFLFPISYLIRDVLAIKNPLIGLVVFQTGINVIFIIIVYPLIGRLAGYLDTLFRTGEEARLGKYLQSANQQFPDEALKTAGKETVRLFLHAIKFNRHVLSLAPVASASDSWLNRVKKVVYEDYAYELEYSNLKRLHGEILDFLVGLKKEDMHPAEIEQMGKLIAIARYNIHAAKNIKDIHHNIHDLDVSVNDILDELLKDIRLSEKEFYNKIEQLLLDPFDKSSPEVIVRMIADNRAWYDKQTQAMLEFLRRDAITELDSSTLLNVFREIYSSNNSLLKGVRELQESVPASAP